MPEPTISPSKGLRIWQQSVFDQDKVKKVRWRMDIEKEYQNIEQRIREKNKVFAVSGIS
jgi:hypothetical protein